MSELMTPIGMVVVVTAAAALGWFRRRRPSGETVTPEDDPFRSAARDVAVAGVVALAGMGVAVLGPADGGRQDSGWTWLIWLLWLVAVLVLVALGVARRRRPARFASPAKRVAGVLFAIVAVCLACWLSVFPLARSGDDEIAWLTGGVCAACGCPWGANPRVWWEPGPPTAAQQAVGTALLHTGVARIVLAGYDIAQLMDGLEHDTEKCADFDRSASPRVCEEACCLQPWARPRPTAR